MHAILHATQFVPAFKAKSGSANLKANSVVFQRPIKANQGDLQPITFGLVTYTNIKGSYKALV